MATYISTTSDTSHLWIPEPEVMDNNSVADEVLKVVNAGYNLCATGSRVTKNFTPISDYDFVVYDWDKKFRTQLDTKEWEEGGSGNLFSDFTSYKKNVKEGTINFIVVSDKEYYRKYVLATELIKKINPPDKKGRVELFDMVFKQEQKEVPF
jgi:hypothetical protein